jgi:hypothetical protein
LVLDHHPDLLWRTTGSSLFSLAIAPGLDSATH